MQCRQGPGLARGPRTVVLLRSCLVTAASRSYQQDIVITDTVISGSSFFISCFSFLSFKRVVGKKFRIPS